MGYTLRRQESYRVQKRETTVYDRIDAAATINFSTQFGAATIQERRLFHPVRVIQCISIYMITSMSCRPSVCCQMSGGTLRRPC